jgi:AcrR family transcriptional regulator
MSPRPRKATDDQIFAAAQRAMTRRGPHELTLADIADEAGVTPGLLVQRFGSKRELLLALSARIAGRADELFVSLRKVHRSALGTLRAYAACMAGLAATPEGLARNLAYLQIDLTDAAFREHLVEHARATRRQIEVLVREAVASGELQRHTVPHRLARSIETAISGSLMTWACYREGPVHRWMRRDLDAVLQPHLARGSPRTSASK